MWFKTALSGSSGPLSDEEMHILTQRCVNQISAWPAVLLILTVSLIVKTKNWQKPSNKEDLAGRLQRPKSGYPNAKKPKTASFVLGFGFLSFEMRIVDPRWKGGLVNGVG